MNAEESIVEKFLTPWEERERGHRMTSYSEIGIVVVVLGAIGMAFKEALGASATPAIATGV